MKTIGIVILHYSNAQDTLECVQSVEKMHIPQNIQLDIIVVDNASPNPFHASDKRVTVLRSDQNRGYSGGNNMGIAYALENGADYILVINNDTTVHRDLVASFLSAAEEFPQAGVFSPKIYFTKGSEYHKSSYKKDELGKVIWYAGGIIDWLHIAGKHIGVDDVDEGQFDEIKQNGFASGCCLFVPKKTFETIGMFDEKYFLYYEDADFSVRVIQKGIQMLFIPKAILWHKNAASTGIGSKLQDYYIARNRMLFGMRFAPVRGKFALIRESMRLLASGRKWQKQGIADYYLNKFGKGSFMS